MVNNIPNELKQLKQWVCYDLQPDEKRPGKLKKTPVNPYTHGAAQSNNPDTWSGFQAALHASKRHSGVGFMFANGYFGVDLDDAEDAIAQFRTDASGIVGEFVSALASYTEISVSGKGIHIICKGKLPSGGRRRGNVEMYESGRFFVMTGDKLTDCDDITECTEAIKPLHAKYIGRPASVSASRETTCALELTDAELIEKASSSSNGAKFMRLYNGEWQSEYGSRSEADIAFCNLLAFWTGKDFAQMDRLYRQSGLMREKWDRRQSGSTYGKLTISKAIKDCGDTYNPSKRDDEYKIYIGKRKISVHSLDDIGNAERLLELYGENIRYNYTSKKWMVYNGQKWECDRGDAIYEMCKNVSDHMREKELNVYVETALDQDAEEAEKTFMKHVRRIRQRKGIADMMKLAESGAPVSTTDFDKDKFLLNLQCGVYDLEKRELRPHSRKALLSKISYSEYSEKADCPTWTNFLNDIFDGDAELIEYVQRCVGYTLTGDTSEQCMFICYGSGRNGKSTFINVLQMLLGEYAINVQPESLMTSKGAGGNGHSSDIARLAGARLAITSESNEGMRFNEGLIKQLTGGDKITASYKYENEFEFTPQFKLWFMSNHKPKVRDNTLGFWRRIRLIPFSVTIPEEKVDKSLKHKLIAELPAIMAWATQGCANWLDGAGLDKEPDIMLSAKQEYQTENDIVQRFLDDCTIADFTGKVGASDLYTAYLQWLEINNERVKLTQKQFGIELNNKLERKRSSAGFYYLGIRLVDRTLDSIVKGLKW